MFSLPLFSRQVCCLLWLATIGMKWYTWSIIKKIVIVYEKSGHFSVNYNALLTTLEINVVVKLVVPIVIVRSTTTCIKNCKITTM
jgi:hypothetical protein